jgi:hypothetical protein
MLYVLSFENYFVKSVFFFKRVLWFVLRSVLVVGHLRIHLNNLYVRRVFNI